MVPKVSLVHISVSVSMVEQLKREKEKIRAESRREMELERLRSDERSQSGSIAQGEMNSLRQELKRITPSWAS